MDYTHFQKSVHLTREEENVNTHYKKDTKKSNCFYNRNGHKSNCTSVMRIEARNAKESELKGPSKVRNDRHEKRLKQATVKHDLKSYRRP